MPAMLTIACSLLLLPGLLWANGEIRPKKESPNIRVSVIDAPRQAIELDARQAPLSEVIDEISRKSGVPIHYSGLPERKVTATCTGETLKQAMECLLGADANLMFKYQKAQSKTSLRGRPEELWILGTSLTKGGLDTKLANSKGMAKRGEKKSADDTAHLEPQEVKELLKQTSNEDPAQRASALSKLTADGRTGDDAVRKVFETALTDKAPDVRAQAVWGLSQQDGASASGVLQDAMQDSDPDVRLMAVDSAGTDELGLALLKAALADSNEAVRGLAANKLAAQTNTGATAN